MDNLMYNDGEKMFKEALDQLMMKDEIINDLQQQIQAERNENSSLRKNISELEGKLALIDDQLEFNVSEEAFKKTLQFNQTKGYIANENDLGKYFNVSGGLNNQISEMTKLIEEKNEIKTNYETLLKEFNNYKEKNKSLSEIEEIFKTQIDSLKRKNEFLENQSDQLKEREKYIEEIMARYKTLEKDWEDIFASKDLEQKELTNQIRLQEENNQRLQNALDMMNQNSNTFTQDLIKEIRNLDEKNKNLEMSLYKAELIYKEDIRKLQSLVSDKQNEMKESVKSSHGLKVEDLATSLTKSIKERIDSQNKKISSQNVELLSLQYEVEKLKSDLKYEKELNQKLQKTLADQKFRIMNITADKEEAGVQTLMKKDDIDSLKTKIKILEDNNGKVNDRNESQEDKIKILFEENQKLIREIAIKEKEVGLLNKKMEKMNKSKEDKLFDRETLHSLANLSKLNMTISALKAREIDLIERVKQLENYNYEMQINSNHQFNNNIENNSNHNSNNHSFNQNQNLDFNNQNNQSNKQTNQNTVSKSLLNNQIKSNMNSVSFNVSADSTNKELINNYSNNQQINFDTQNNQNQSSNNNYTNNYPSYSPFCYGMKSNQSSYSPYLNTNNYTSTSNQINKDILSEKYELELKALGEDNYFLRTQNFKLISDINKFQENINNLKLHYDNLIQEKQQIEIENSNICQQYEKVIEGLKIELEKSKILNNEIIEEMKNKLNSLSTGNLKMSEQFNSLQNKFYVQSSLISDKNLEINNLKRSLETTKDQNEDLSSQITELKSKNEKLEIENRDFKTNLDKIKKENEEIRNKYKDEINKLNYSIKETEERNKILNSENENLKISNNKIKNKINGLYEENKEKENKIISLLKEENKEIEKRMRDEINELRGENENLMKERSHLRLSNNDLIYENKLLKEKEYPETNNLTKRGRNSSTDNSKNNFSKTQNLQFNSNNLSNCNSLNNSFSNSHSSHINKRGNKNENLLPNNKEINIMREENTKLRKEIESILIELNTLEKECKNLSMENQSLNLENNRFKDLLENKDKDIKLLKLEVTTLTNSNIHKNESDINKLLNEISTKNQTINYLIDEVESVKKENQENIKLLSNEKDKIESENKMLTKNLYDLQKDFEMLKNHNDRITDDLKKENEILLTDLEEREREMESLIKEKVKNENNYVISSQKMEDKIVSLKDENNKLISENETLQLEVENISNETITKFSELNNKFEKSKTKVEKLVDIYESHIKFLKERFLAIHKDLYTVLNNKPTNDKNLTEKIIKSLKLIESNVENVSKISEREAIIENLKSENKMLKINLNNLNEKTKRLNQENLELNETINIKKLQMKIKPGKNENNSLVTLINFQSATKELSALKLNLNNTKLKLCSQIEENKLLCDKNNHLETQNENYENNVKTQEEEISKLNKDLNETNKSHKNEIGKIMEELKKIKEKWLPPEKQNEYNSTIEELEKNIKSLKEDVNRKRELITTLKGQNNELSSTIKEQHKLNSSGNISNTGNNNITNLEEKMKTLNKEITKKDNLIKELRTTIENLKTNEKKINEENTTMTEKIKINKIDIQRKDNIIKELKQKCSSQNDLDNSKISENNENIKESINKLKFEVERKDGIIKTLKAKLETSNMEIEQLRMMNLKLNKNNSNEIEKEQKLQEEIRNKLDLFHFNNENLLSVLRRIFKDLISTYEKLKAKFEMQVFSFDNNRLKEGMDILGVSQDDLGDYLTNPNLELYDKVNKLLDSRTIEAETFFSHYNSLKNKIASLKGE